MANRKWRAIVRTADDCLQSIQRDSNHVWCSSARNMTRVYCGECLKLQCSLSSYSYLRSRLFSNINATNHIQTQGAYQSNFPFLYVFCQSNPPRFHWSIFSTRPPMAQCYPQPSQPYNPQQNLNFYQSSYPAPVSGHTTPSQAQYPYSNQISYGQSSSNTYGGSSSFGGFGGAAAPGVSGRMGEQGGLRTGWLAAFGTEGYEGEPPLLEELGVNFGHIKGKVSNTYTTSRVLHLRSAFAELRS